MKSQFFKKNLILFLIPLLIPVIILGTLSIRLTQENVREEINQNNTKLLNHIHHNIELIFSELESLSISFNNSEVILALEEILRTQKMSPENSRLLDSTKNYIDSPTFSRPYIHSIYVYVNNENNQFLASGDGIANLDKFYDTEWFNSFLENKNEKRIWSESRLIKQYEFEKPMPITTIYKTLYSTVSHKPSGVMVLNIYTKYFESLLTNIETYPNQRLFIMNEQNNILATNSLADNSPKLDIHEILSHDNSLFKIKAEDKFFIGSQRMSTKYDWRFISVIPQHSLYQIPLRLGTYTILIVFISLTLGILLTFYLTKRNDNHIRKIISIFQSAEKGQPLPVISTSRKYNEHDYIAQNIIKNFVEQNYLKVQLSEKKYRLKTAELLALQSQINPHFLFNTLETIYWKALGLTGNYNMVNSMLENLSDLLKYSLDQSDKLVTIHEEIEITKSYIEIQQVRYKDKFHCYWEYDEELVKRHSVIKLILQPLIENAIIHGIIKNQEKGKIKIKITKSHSFIRLTVIDNGIGITPEKLQQIRQNFMKDEIATKHIGLVNTYKRIELSYEQNYKIAILSKYNWGTAVSIAIPID